MHENNDLQWWNLPSLIVSGGCTTTKLIASCRWLLVLSMWSPWITYDLQQLILKSWNNVLLIKTHQNLPSSIVIVKLQDTEFWDASLNTYVTAVVPGPNWSPGWCVLLCSAASPQLSVALGSVHVIDVVPLPKGIVLEISAGGVHTGGVGSTERGRIYHKVIAQSHKHCNLVVLWRRFLICFTACQSLSDILITRFPAVLSIEPSKSMLSFLI